jgi:energy-converting hydrogenase Eha subunit H
MVYFKNNCLIVMVIFLKICNFSNGHIFLICILLGLREIFFDFYIFFLCNFSLMFFNLCYIFNFLINMSEMKSCEEMWKEKVRGKKKEKREMKCKKENRENIFI